MDSVIPDRSDGRDTLRISQKEQGEILAELESRSPSRKSSERRGDERLRYVQRALLFVQVRHPGGTISNYLVRTRNLSKTGIGFLHGTFLYSGTPCTVSLRAADNKSFDVEGTVVRCSHVRGHIHDVGVRFVRPIRLRDFVPRGAAAGADEVISSELPRLLGKVLHIEDSADDQELLKFHLNSLGVTVESAPSGIDALEIVSSVHFDMIVSAMWLPGMSGPEIAQSLRQSGYSGPIIAMTADERDETRLEALDRGFTALLVKPYLFEDLLRLLVQYLRAAPQQGQEQRPIVSRMWSDKLMRPLITRFLGRLDGQLKQIERLIGVSGTEPLIQKLCMDLKGSAGGYGFPQISSAAQNLLGALLKNAEPGEVHRQLDILAGLCTAAIRSLENLDRTTDTVAPQ